MTTVSASDPLRAFLSGKRRSPRVSLQIPAILRAGGLEIPAEVKDVSEGGVLISVDGATIQACGLGGLPMMALHERLGAGFRLVLPGMDFERDAVPIRVASPMGEGERVYVGCRFDRPLTASEQRRVGLLDAGRPIVTPEWTAAVLLDALPIRVRRGARIDVFAHGDGQVVGPRFVGRLLGFGDSVVGVACTIARDRGVFETIGDDMLTLTFRRRGADLWTTQARPAAVRPGARGPCDVEIGLIAEEAPPPALRRHLVRRRS